MLEASILLTGKKDTDLVLLLWNEEMLREHLYIRYTSTKRNRVEGQVLNETTQTPKFSTPQELASKYLLDSAFLIYQHKCNRNQRRIPFCCDPKLTSNNLQDVGNEDVILMVKVGVLSLRLKSHQNMNQHQIFYFLFF